MKSLNCKVVDLDEIYNLCIKLFFIQAHLIKLCFFENVKRVIAVSNKGTV
jgi:hypothetical protein